MDGANGQWPEGAPTPGLGEQGRPWVAERDLEEPESLKPQKTGIIQVLGYFSRPLVDCMTWAMMTEARHASEGRPQQSKRAPKVGSNYCSRGVEGRGGRGSVFRKLTPTDSPALGAPASYLALAACCALCSRQMAPNQVSFLRALLTSSRQA